MTSFQIRSRGLAGRSFVLLTALVLCSTQALSQTAAPSGTLGFIGTYTGEKSKGIYSFRFDSSGSLTAPVLAAETPNPTFLAIHPNGRFLYAANEVGKFEEKKSGAVTAYAIDAETGALTLLNQKPSGGEGPCHISVDAAGKNVLVANYGGGSIEVIPLTADGRLAEPGTFIQHEGSGLNKKRQEKAHAHFITTDPADHFALTCDLGLDKVLVYRFNPAKASLSPNDPPAVSIRPPGSGPRHFAFDPKGPHAYVINEMGCSITTLNWDAERGELKEVQNISTLPKGQQIKPNFSTAEIEVHPSGRFLYGSNRGHDTIAVFAIDATTGKLTLLQNQSTLGKTPRHFAIDPSGNFLIAENQDSDSLAVFRIDSRTGRLTSTGQLVVGVGAPVCIKFLPTKQQSRG